jgi:hypothetical protein
MLSLSELTERPPLNGWREELVSHLVGSGKNGMQDWIFGKELEKDIAYMKFEAYCGKTSPNLLQRRDGTISFTERF